MGGFESSLVAMESMEGLMRNLQLSTAERTVAKIGVFSASKQHGESVQAVGKLLCPIRQKCSSGNTRIGARLDLVSS